MPEGAHVAWSCVLDDKPAIWRDFAVWVATLMDCAGVPAENIVVHHVTELRPDVLILTQKLGLRAVRIPAFDQRSPHSNKILQCATDFGTAKRVVFTDVDLAFVSRPPVDRIDAPIAGKSVDLPNPPVEVLEEIFRHAGMTLPATMSGMSVIASERTSAFETFVGNYNGGFYVIDCSVQAQLGATWEGRARWLLDGDLIPEPWKIHVDQISFCMAVHELGLSTEELSIAWNLPSHLLTVASDDVPFVIHHHGRLNENRALLPLQPPRHDVAIALTNFAISEFMDRHELS